MSNTPRSKAVYIELARQDIARFRFLLEAHDNLALFSVLDRFRAVGKVFFAPQQEQDVRRALAALASELCFRVLSDSGSEWISDENDKKNVQG